MRRFISTLIAFCMLVCCIPNEAFAMMGAAEYAQGVKSGTYSDNNTEFAYLENDYIRFDINTKGADTYTVTQPTRTKKGAYDMIFNKKIYQHAYFDSGSIQSKTVTLSEYAGQKSIKADYILNGGKHKAVVYYTLVRLDKGTDTGFTAGGQQQKDENDAGRAWGVRAVVGVGYNGNTPDFERGAAIRYKVDMKNFARMGHESVADGAELYMSSAVGNTNHGFTHSVTAIPGAMSRTRTNVVTGMDNNEAITEILTRGYSWANPFTLTSGLYPEYEDGYSPEIDGYRNGYTLPEYFSTSANGDVTVEAFARQLMGIEVPSYASQLIWGFRELYKSDETNFTPNDNIRINTSAKRLGIYKKGDSFIFKTAKYSAEMDIYNRQYGAPVAEIKGDFTDEDDRYVFTSGVALISGTITAVWPKANGGFSIGKDGSIELKNVSLNCPTFKFYQPKTENGLSMELTADGIALNMNPDSNSATMALNIPNTKTKADSGLIKSDGSISFKGVVEFQIFPGAEFTMEELGFGKNARGSFKMNGIHATGKVDTSEMIGLDMAKLEGEINSFKGYYKFEMELNVFDLFESEAQLELKRSTRTGMLLPNKVYFYAGSEIAKIPLVSPVIVAYIKGAGGGFDGLADTVNGDFFAIPPITFSITGKGEVLNVIEAKATYTLGPASYRLKAEDVGIAFLKKLNLIDEFEIYEGVQGETRSYGGTNYTGLNAFGGASVHISVPQKSKIIQAKGSLDASAFAGLDSYSAPTKVYVVADLNGGVRGSMHLPDNWGAIGGLKLGSTGFDFYLGASTVARVNGGFENAVKSAYKNFKPYGGVKKEADWKIFKYRVYYIFPENDAGFTIRSIFRKLPEWNWEDHKPSGYSAEFNDENGGLAVMAMNVDELGAVVTQDYAAYANQKDVTLDLSEGETLTEGSNVIMMITPADDNTDIDAFIDGISISKGGVPIQLTKPVYNENSEIINESEVNVFATTNANGKKCVLVGLGEADGSIRNGDVWSVTATSGDFDASLNISEPLDSLSLALSGYDLTGRVVNPEENGEYVLATYFGNTEGGTDYIINHADVTDTISETIPQSGTMLSSGEYYVTAKLLKKAEAEIENEEGIPEKTEILLPVDEKHFGRVSYTNTAQPSEPANVSIKAIGNEIMNGEWSEVDEADGYKITIYQKDSNGNYINTNKGYAFDKDAAVNGISYDAASKTYKLDMALTVGGFDVQYDGEGNPVTTQNNDTLKADESYRIGVQAYKYLQSYTDESGNPVKACPVYSAEKQSNEAELPKYSFADDFRLNIAVKIPYYKDIEHYSIDYITQNAEEENGVYTCSAGEGIDGLWTINVSSGEPNVSYTLTPVDFNAQIDENPDESNSWIMNNTNINGSVMLRIDVRKDMGTYTDTATKYLVIEKDDSASVLSFDNDIFYADKTSGEYTLTGTADKNARILSSTDASVSAQADENGRFSISGTLLMDWEDNENRNGQMMVFYAQDENGNMSEAANVFVIKKEDAQTLTAINITVQPNKTAYAIGESFDPAGMVVTAVFADGSEVEVNDYTYDPADALSEGTTAVTVSYTFGTDTKQATVPISVGNTPSGGHGGGSLGGNSNYIVSFDTNGGSKLISQLVLKNTAMKEPAAPTKDGYDFEGWYTDKELTSRFDFTKRVTGNMTLYAAWTVHDASKNQIILTIGKTDVTVFGKSETNDVAPIVVNDRTMLPARFVAENLGASVDWDADKKLVTVKGKNEKNEDITILITIDSDTAYVNGEAVKLDSPAFIQNERTYTPLRFIAENLGADVDWNGDELKVIITKKSKNL